MRFWFAGWVWCLVVRLLWIWFGFCARILVFCFVLWLCWCCLFVMFWFNVILYAYLPDYYSCWIWVVLFVLCLVVLFVVGVLVVIWFCFCLFWFVVAGLFVCWFGCLFVWVCLVRCRFVLLCV